MRDHEPREQSEPDSEQQHRRAAGREQVRDPRRVAVDDRRQTRRTGGGGVGPDRQVQQRHRDEAVRHPVDGPAPGVGIAGARLGAREVVPDRPADRHQEDRDPERPGDGADGCRRIADLAGKRQQDGAAGRQGKLDRGRQRGRQLPVEVGRHQRVGLPEHRVQDEAVQPEDHPGPATHPQEGRRAPDDQKHGPRGDEPPRAPGAVGRAHGPVTPVFRTPARNWWIAMRRRYSRGGRKTSDRPPLRSGAEWTGGPSSGRGYLFLPDSRHVEA